MTTTDEDLHRDVHPARQWGSLGIAVLVTVPGIVFRLGGLHLSDPLDALVFGVAIVGSAFLLSWAAEAAQLDISGGLAIAILALIAVLPEYVVDAVFAVKGGEAFERFGSACQSAEAALAGRESDCSLALANMTGANRLLIGLGWSMVVFIAWWRYRQRGQRFRGVDLDSSHSVELGYLAVATLFSLSLPLKSTITLIDSAVLVTIFVLYTIRIARAPAEAPHLVGPARVLGSLSTSRRRMAVIGLFVGAAAVIFLVAEHFAEALVASGQVLGISEFFLVQWLAPLASEAPELLVAGLFAWRLNTEAGLGTLVSSKVNQWTLLVGTLPVAFAISSGGLNGLPLVPRQQAEVFLTAAQSVFAVAILLNLSMSLREAAAVFGLFAIQFVTGALVPERLHEAELVTFGVIYLILGAVITAQNRGAIRRLAYNAFRAPYGELE